jgi:uncharacterized protein YtpQ (UPF0354 family)
LSKKEFLQIYYDSMTRRLPDVKFKIADNFTIIGKFQEKEVRHAIDNAFSDYVSTPDSLGSILHRYVVSAVDVYTLSQEPAQDNIVPIIKPVKYLADMDGLKAQVGAKKGFDGVYEPYNAQLLIVYAQDTKTGIRYFPEDALKRAGIAKDTLRQLAIKNLNRLLSSQIELRGGNGVYMFTAGGNYEASIILLDDIWTKDNMQVDGDFVIGIPSRDVLLVTGSNDKVGISKLKDAVQKTYSTGNYTVSDYLYRRVGNKFVKYE